MHHRGDPAMFSPQAVEEQGVDQRSKECLRLAAAGRHIEKANRILVERGIEATRELRKARGEGWDVREDESQLEQTPSWWRFALTLAICSCKGLVEKKPRAIGRGAG